MTAYDWLMAVGALAIVTILVKAFWVAREIEPNEPDERLPGG